VKIRQFIAGAVVSAVTLTSMVGVADAKPKKPKKPAVPKAGQVCKTDHQVVDVPTGRLLCMQNSKGKLVWHVSNLPYNNAAANDAAGAALPTTDPRFVFEVMIGEDERVEWAYLSDLVAYFLPNRLTGFRSAFINDAAQGTYPGVVDIMEIANPSPAAANDLITAIANGKSATATLVNDVPVIYFTNPDNGATVTYLAYGSHLVRIVLDQGDPTLIMNALFATAGLPAVPAPPPAA
jgi:hypothetical protein